MDDLLIQARKSLSLQPFSTLLGATIEHVDVSTVTITLPMRKEFEQQNGFAHGGIVSYLADNSLTFAGALGGLGHRVLTGEYKINYIRPAAGDSLVARATVVHAGKSQAVCRSDVYARTDTGERLVATAQGTIVKVTSAPSD